MSAPLPDPPPLTDREIVVAVCGGIAAYKAAEVVSQLAQRGAGVTVVMTAAARKFVTPLTFATLSGRPVLTGTFAAAEANPQHISLTERADLMLVAPATSNLIAKAANGICDDIVSLMIAAAACPVVFAPAMNNRMWENPIATENRAKLQRIGYRFIGPDDGWLACRNVGPGRLSEPGEIVEEVTRLLAQATEAAKLRKQPS
ncbi:MAG: flavoprotein [Tepidisphaeraceae bacterium]|jgi:phosphopantothenoylcysteine decarboxylase/phosphopantothenate--cysteine ligase